MNGFYKIFILLLLIGCKGEEKCIVLTESDYAENAKSEKKYDDGELDIAIQMANKIIQSNDQNYIAYSNRATFNYGKCLKKGKFYDTDKQSIYGDLEKSIKICPRFAKGFRNMIKIAYQLNDFDRVIEYSKIYISKFKQRSRILTLYADALWEKGFFEKGLKYSNLAIKTKPVYEYSYTVKGKCLSGLEEYDKAISVFNIALEKDSTRSLSYSERGYCYKMKNQMDRAKEDYYKSISLDSSRIAAYVTLGSIEVDKGNLVEGCKLYMKAKRMFEKDTDLARNKRTEEAIEQSLDKYCF